MENIIIYGIGDLADQLYRYINTDKQYRVLAFTVENNYINCCTFFGLPVIPFEKLADEYINKDSYKILVCVGYNNMNQTRTKIFSNILINGYHIASYIHPTATVLTESLGYGNIILENANLSIGSKLGNGNIIYNNAVICHDTKIGNFNFLAPNSCILGFSEIGNNCFLGAHSTIRNKIIINDMCLIGAQCFVTEDMNKGEVMVPAMSKKLNKSSTDMNI